MKRLILIVISLCITMLMQAQVSKTVNVTAGGLSTALTPAELNTVTNLTLTGTIDARDFKTMRDNMPVLAVLDLGGTAVAGYSGTEGTSPDNINYPANEVPYHAFYHNYSIEPARLKSVKLPSSVTVIGNGAFYNCTGLTSVTLPASVNSIGDRAFEACTGLTSITIPSSVNFIGEFAFISCISLTSIILPASVTSIGVQAFSSCIGLTSIEISSSVTSIVNGVFRGCTRLTSITIPSSVTSIGESAFNGCTGLTSITIPSSVNQIGWSAFYDCYNLTSIYAYGVTPVNLSSSSYVFYHVNKTTCILYVPFGTSALYAAANQWKDFTNIVEISVPEQSISKTLKVTAGGLFSALTADERITITSLKLTGTIDARDFKTMRDNMPSLTELDISAAAVAAYSGMAGTTTYTQAYPANAIPEQAFYNQTAAIGKANLRSVIFPSSATNIGFMAFNLCTGLTSLTLPPSLESIGGCAFMDCSRLTSFSTPSSVTYIGSSAFFRCTGLTSVNIPSSVTWIQSGTFENCRSLTSINIPSSIISIDDRAFLGCVKLNTVIIPSSVEFIMMRAFEGCWGLTTLNIPSSVTSIEYNTFTSCFSLPSITIPSSVSNIETGAFENCSSLKSIYAYRATPVDLSSSVQVFGGIDKLACILYVPVGSLSLYAAADQWKDFTHIVEISVPEQSISKTLEVSAGGLFQALTVDELNKITRLTIIGTIDARDFKTMREKMPILSEVDLSWATVAAYSGTDGTNSEIFNYPANEIPYQAFFRVRASTRLRSVIFPLSATSIGSYAFDNCTGLTSLSLPPSLTFIGSYAFRNCTGFTSINFLSSVKTIEQGTFESCLGLTSIIIPTSITSIGSHAFLNCTKLTTVTIPSSVTNIDYLAFGGCTGLTTVNIPTSVTTIRDETFRACSSLPSITIPSSVSNIERGAFQSCDSLKSIYAYRTTPVDLSSSDKVFEGVNKINCILYVPFGTSALYAAADQWKDFINIVEIPVAGSIAANQSICSGSTPAPLTSTSAGAGQGAISYRWEYSNNGTTWLSTGTSGETFAPGALAQTTLFRRITISTLNGKSWESAPTEPVTITVTSTITPTVSISASQNNVCAGTPVTFTATPVNGGTTPAYTWFLNNVARATGATGTYTPKNGDVVYAEMTSGLGCVMGNPATSNAITMVVNEAVSGSVSINISQNNVCAGTPVTFTATPVNGGTTPAYKWFLNNVAEATGATGTYTPKNGDVVYAEMTSGLGCLTVNPVRSNSITMVVNEAVSGSVSINVSQNNVCAGTPVTFTALPVGGGTTPSFLWYLNNVARATGVSGTYAPKNGDEVYVEMTSGSRCAPGIPVKSGVVTMIVDGIPAQPAWFTQGTAYVFQGQSDIRYTVPNVVGVTYHWSYDGTGATITGTSNSVLISFSRTATSGTLSVRTSNSCGISEPRSGVIMVGTTVKAGVLTGNAGQVIMDVPAKKAQLNVYPNPSADGPVTFDFRITERAKVILELFSSSGMRISRIYEGDAEEDVIQTVIFNESLAPGVYIYMLKWKDHVITGKLIRNR